MKRLKKVAALFLIVTLIFIFGGCQQNQEENKATTVSKKDTGPSEVKYVPIKIIKEKVGKKKKWVSRQYKYDKEGNLISKVNFRENGEISSAKKYEYDRYGRVKKMIKTGLINNTKIYNYDKQGRKIGYILKDKTGWERGKGVYKYYDNGNLKYEYIEDNGFSKTKRHTYYNRQGEKEKIVETNTMYNTVSTFEREYDEQGRKRKEIKTKKFKNLGDEVKDIDYYNLQGKKIKSITKNGDRIVWWYEQEYDEQGNATKFLQKNEKGELIEYTTYEYDEQGNVVREINKQRRVSGGFRINRWFDRQYDENNNLVKSCFKGPNGKIGSISYWKYKKIGGE